MKINFKFLNKERAITLKDFIRVMGEILFLFCIVELLQYHVVHVNDEEIEKMQAAIPFVKSMDGTENLPGKIKMVSKAKGLYYGNCYIDEKADERKIVDHYKSEFEKNGWKYIGRFYWQDIHPERNIDERYYYFEQEDNYCMYLCLQMGKYLDGGKTRVIFSIDLKKDDDNRKYCRIENN